jgi:hypothetical protein
MAGHRGRIRTSVVAIGALVLVLALSACNPIVGQTTEGFEGIPPYIPASSYSASFDFTSTASGWLEIQVTESANPAVSVSGQARYPELTTCPEFPPTWAWVDGASTGFQRLGRVDPGAQVSVSAAGSSDPIRFNLRVVDDEGQPMGDLAPHVDPPGQFPSVGCAIG